MNLGKLKYVGVLLIFVALTIIVQQSSIQKTEGTPGKSPIRKIVENMDGDGGEYTGEYTGVAINPGGDKKDDDDGNGGVDDDGKMEEFEEPHDYAVYSTTTKEVYAFYIPLTMLVWKERQNFDSIIFLVGKKEEFETPVMKVLMKYLNIFMEGTKSKIEIIEIDPEKAVSMSQVVRLFAAYLPYVNPESYLITSDSDLWTINQELYRIKDKNKELLLLNAFCCGSFNLHGKNYRMFPMGHIGMKAKTWKSVMQLNESGTIVYDENGQVDISASANKEADRFFRAPDCMKNIVKGADNWYYDQHMISAKIEDTRMIDKAEQESMSGQRLDRAGWGSPTSVNSFTRDAHLPHGAHQAEVWETVHYLLKALITPESYKLALEYQKEFEEAYKKSQEEEKEKEQEKDQEKEKKKNKKKNN